MKIAAHIEKFQRLDSVLQRLDRVADSELWIWTAMNACTHLLNAALHHVGATTATDSFHTQTSGLYAVPDRSSGTLHDSMHSPGDVMHVGQPPLEQALPPNVVRACAALRILEDLRSTQVRGSEALDLVATERWEQAYRECVAQLSPTIAATRE